MVGYSNSYTLTRPKDEFGKLAKYTKLLDFVKAHRTEEFSRVDLFVKSGYSGGLTPLLDSNGKPIVKTEE